MRNLILMRFLYPEILYALFALVIPIVVHLFRLRKFRKEYFTNVALLKKIQLQTRKSAELKKWLVLFARLGVFTLLILAFAQPVSETFDDTLESSEVLVYLDNSMSMQAEDASGALMDNAVQQIISNFPEAVNFTLFTNHQTFPQSNIEDLRNDILDLKISPTSLDANQLKLQAQTLFGKTSKSKKLVVLSDFQSFSPAEIANLPDTEIYVAQQKPLEKPNVSIDSITQTTGLEVHKMEVWLSAGANVEDIPVSVYDGDKLLAKSTASIAENKPFKLVFSLPATDVYKGRINIEDNGFALDNERFFTIEANRKTNVMAIGDADDAFLKKIYTADEFNFRSSLPVAVDFSFLQESDLIVLNELKNFPAGLPETLSKLIDNGHFLILVMPSNADLNSYNTFFRLLKMPTAIAQIESERFISEISQQHPVFQGVFEKNIQNFDYPFAKKHFAFRQPHTRILSFDNGDGFMLAFNRQVFVFTGPLSEGNSNFKNSPLVVPTFYNPAKMSFAMPQLYYTLGQTNFIDISAKPGTDEVLKINTSTGTYIPMQVQKNEKVSLTFSDFPNEPGHYTVMLNGEILRNLAFNYPKVNWQTPDFDVPNDAENFKIFDSSEKMFEALNSVGEETQLWKWFVIFALVFLLAEMLILKYLP
ncbi:MAG: BatA domain-containing protein [Bacteroidetes bacterium]|nr:BatA domain-containing protein [Bacteroidota bacterium]